MALSSLFKLGSAFEVSEFVFTDRVNIVFFLLIYGIQCIKYLLMLLANNVQNANQCCLISHKGKSSY